MSARAMLARGVRRVSVRGEMEVQVCYRAAQGYDDA